MTLVRFDELVSQAEAGNYAVGYFESWNLESLLAVADAAEATQSPVLLGFSGIYLPHPARLTRESLGSYAAMGLEACKRLSVPACLVFNESPHLDWVMEALRLQFGMVMFSDGSLDFEQSVTCVREVVEKAHACGAAVEGELGTVPGVGGELAGIPPNLNLTDCSRAREFVERTGVDALAVNVGQAHLHAKSELHLDLDRLEQLRLSVGIPLVLHGATSVCRDDLVQAIRIGVSKINVGSALKRTYFEALSVACSRVGPEYNPYQVMGSGFAGDVLTEARLELQKTVEYYMRLFQPMRNFDQTLTQNH